MRTTAWAVALCIVSAASAAVPAEPKLINAKRVFPAGDEPWRTGRPLSLWAMRLSPDGKSLLYPRPKGRPPLTPEGHPDWFELKYELVLRDLGTGKQTLLPIAPLDSGWRTVFTRFNMFDPAGKRLALVDMRFEQTSRGNWTDTQVVLYDTASAKATPAHIRGSTRGPHGVAKFNRTGKGLIVMKGRDLYTAPLPKLQLRPLAVKGMLQSVCPAADVICILHFPSPAATRPARGLGLLLYDLKAGKETARLPMHERNSSLDDWETQWTADGRYLYYYDVREDPADTSGRPRKRTKPLTRIWDRPANKQIQHVLDAVPVGPGPTATTMVLAKRGQTPSGGFLLHDAKSGGQWPLADSSMKLLHAWGGKVLYAKRSGDGKETVYLAEIEMPK